MSQNQRKRKRQPNSRGEPAPSPDLHEKLSWHREPGLFTPEEAKPLIPEAVKAALNELRTATAVEGVLTYIVGRYVKEREYHRNRPKPQAYRRLLASVASAARRLMENLNVLPGYVRGELGRRIHRHFVVCEAASDPVLSEPSIDPTISLLQRMVVEAKLCEEELRSSRTNPGNTHLHYVVSALKALWCEATGKAWVKDYGWAPLRPKPGQVQEFIGAGPLFVQRVMKAIDPEVGIKQLRSAMAALDAKEYSREGQSTPRPQSKRNSRKNLRESRGKVRSP